MCFEQQWSWVTLTEKLYINQMKIGLKEITVSPRKGMYTRRFDSSWHMQDTRFQIFFGLYILPSKY